MLSEKYRPERLDDMGRVRAAEVLKGFDADTFPSLIITGGAGAGKRTLLLALLRHLYGKRVAFTVRTADVAVSPSKRIEVSLLESNECLELRAADYGSSDKKVIQEIIREVSSTQSIRGLINPVETKKTKTLIIPDAEFLSRGAQMALRRTMEKHARNFRLILLCRSTSSLIEAVRSRFLVCRVPAYSDEEIAEICASICKKEKREVGPGVLKEIVAGSRGNLRRALSLMEISMVTGGSKAPLLDWEKSLLAIAKTMKESPGVASLVAIREMAYDLLARCIPGREILLHLMHQLVSQEAEGTAAKIAAAASVYDSRLANGSKDIFHIEGFVAAVMAIYETGR